MKVSYLESNLCSAAINLAASLAESDQCIITQAEYFNLIFTPAEQTAYDFLKPRLTNVYQYGNPITINFGVVHDPDGGGTQDGKTFKRVAVSCVPMRGVELPIAPGSCSIAHSADPDLVARVLAWHGRRLELGFIAAAFREYCTQVAKASPTLAHAYRVFPSIMTVMTRCPAIDAAARREATRIKTRELFYPKPEYQGLANIAAEAAALIELMPSLEIKNPPNDTFALRVISGDHNRYYPARAVGMGTMLNPA